MIPTCVRKAGTHNSDGYVGALATVPLSHVAAYPSSSFQRQDWHFTLGQRITGELRGLHLCPHCLHVTSGISISSGILPPLRYRSITYA